MPLPSRAVNRRSVIQTSGEPGDLSKRRPTDSGSERPSPRQPASRFQPGDSATGAWGDTPGTTSQSISLGERPARWVAPELADPVDPVEGGQREDVEELGASRRREGLEALAEGLLHVLEGHDRTLVR